MEQSNGTQKITKTPQRLTIIDSQVLYDTSEARGQGGSQREEHGVDSSTLVSKDMNMSVILVHCFFLLAFASKLPSFNGTFVPIATLAEEDAHGLHGLAYNDTQPPVTDPLQLLGFRIGFVVSHCFEEVELTFPYIYFARRSAQVDILGPWWSADQQVASCEYARAKTWVKMTKSFREVELVELYDAIVIPGGVWSSTVVRNDPNALKLIETALMLPTVLVASVCSGTTVMVNAGYFKSAPKDLSQCTGSPSIRIDLENAGCEYLDQPVVVHPENRVIFGRSPHGNDNLLFTQAIAKQLMSPL